MTFDQWIIATNEAFTKQVHQRYGQFFMNSLYDIRPELFNKLIDTPNNPFYNNSRIGAFLVFLVNNW